MSPLNLFTHWRGRIKRALRKPCSSVSQESTGQAVPGGAELSSSHCPLAMPPSLLLQHQTAPRNHACRATEQKGHSPSDTSLCQERQKEPIYLALWILGSSTCTADLLLMAPSVIKGGRRVMRLVQFHALFSCFTCNVIKSSDSLQGACGIHVELTFQLPRLSSGNDNNNVVDVVAVLYPWRSKDIHSVRSGELLSELLKMQLKVHISFQACQTGYHIETSVFSKYD